MRSSTPWPLCIALILLGVLLTVGHAAQAQDLSGLLASESASGGTAGDRVIAVGRERPDDDAITARLRQIYREVDGLDGVTVRSSGGVVSLRGVVGSGRQAERALRFAEQVEGVVAVESEIAIDRSLAEGLRAGWASLLAGVATVVARLPLLLAALLIVGLSWLIGRWLGSRRALLGRLAPNPFVALFLGQFAHIACVVVGIFAALVLFDATSLIGTLLGAAGLVGLALGFAVRDTVENTIASLLLSVRNPFAVNDLVSIDGHEGNVVRLTSRATVLLSPDGNHIRIPNAAVFKAVIVNYSRHAERRFQFDIGVDTDLDLLPTLTLAADTLSAVEGVLEEPRPVVVVESLGDSNVVLRAFAWVNQTRASFLKVRSEAIRAVKDAFDRAGIVMPEPVYQLRMVQGPAVSPAGDRPRPSAARRDAPVTPDVRADRTIEKKVGAEQHRADEENLLNPQTAREF